MKSIVLALFAALIVSAGSASAASYRMTDGTIVDPIQKKIAGASTYSGPNLEPGANLSNANLGFAYLSNADLSNADLSNADLEYVELDYADLEYTNLGGAYLGDANLDFANLYGADLSYANLDDAGFSEADLRYANLSYANLGGAYLGDADLSYANLSNADLGTTWMPVANLSNADLTNARLFYARFSNGIPAHDPIGWNTATWTGAKYLLNAVDNNGNPIPDTVFPAGMDQAWRDAAGMVAVPEPTTAVLVGLGLIGLGVRRRS